MDVGWGRSFALYQVHLVDLRAGWLWVGKSRRQGQGARVQAG